MPEQPKHRQTAQNIWTLGIYKFIRQISPKQVDEPEPGWLPPNKPGTIPAKGLTPKSAASELKEICAKQAGAAAAQRSLGHRSKSPSLNDIYELYYQDADRGDGAANPIPVQGKSPRHVYTNDEMQMFIGMVEAMPNAPLNQVVKFNCSEEVS